MSADVESGFALASLPVAPTVLVTASEAAQILGVRLHTVYVMANRGQLQRHAPSHARRAYALDELERRSLARLKYHTSGHPYWLTMREVADILEVGPSRVRVLMAKDKVPHVRAPEQTPLRPPRTNRSGRPRPRSPRRQIPLAACGRRRPRAQNAIRAIRRYRR